MEHGHANVCGALRPDLLCHACDDGVHHGNGDVNAPNPHEYVHARDFR